MFESDAFDKRVQAMEDELSHRVDDKLRQQLRERTQRDKVKERLAIEIHRLATKVASASGGMLGRGKISKAEQKILDEIASNIG